ncbi:MAG: hypothetical protein FJ344_01010 [Sphingomonadales bacterium]|nr:hypothetical protein [Sphingomonadales bacterium]
MSYKRLNSDLIDLIDLRNELYEMAFNDPKYDDLEDELHDFEDTFNRRYQELIEPILIRIHKKLTPEIPHLIPTAYVGNHYEYLSETDTYETDGTSGVVLENGQGHNFRLTFIPNPTRLLLTSSRDMQVVWNENQPDEAIK